MMRQYQNPPRSDWAEICKRPNLQMEFLDGTVKNIINRVKISGDAALKEMLLQFDKVKLDTLKVTEKEIESGQSQVSNDLKVAIQLARENITKFHEAQRRDTLIVETMPGVKCWRKPVPIERAGIYVPGGATPLFSTLLMLGIPASLAGCEEVLVCTPPRPDGTIHPAILFVAFQIGIKNIYKVGGAQAIAAMAFGTETIPRVFKIFGPGNQYVTKAKQLVSTESVAVDLPAGPSEVMVVADDNAHVNFIAADLLSQAEHGEDSQVVLISSSRELIKKVEKEVEIQLSTLPRKKIATAALRNSITLLLNHDEDIADFINSYAPEHLILHTTDCEQLAEKVKNAGSVFVGPYTPESLGDYASGTNHTLPTNGYAKAYSGVSLESFQKFITFQKVTKGGLDLLGPTVEIMAETEQLLAHKQAISIRRNEI